MCCEIVGKIDPSEIQHAMSQIGIIIDLEEARALTKKFVSAAFYPRDAMRTRSLRQRHVCLSVCLSIRHMPVLCLAERKQDHELYTF